MVEMTIEEARAMLRQAVSAPDSTPFNAIPLAVLVLDIDERIARIEGSY